MMTIARIKCSMEMLADRMTHRFWSNIRDVFFAEKHHLWKDGNFAYRVVERNVSFPPSQGLQVNMMPFEWGNKQSLPHNLQCYWPMIQACSNQQHRPGDIYYLTIDERFVPAGSSQRRPGIHIDSVVWPTKLTDGGSMWTQWLPMRHPLNPMSNYHHWGVGHLTSNWSLSGGIYLASNLSNSSRVWRTTIRQPWRVIGEHGDLEWARWILGHGEKVPSNTLVWITDRTPHESLPLDIGSERQFFRLVTSKIGVWFANHSTPNPLGIQPNAKIVNGNKFG